ncbi:GNAT family N-acetyltransferase [Paenibacillus silvisoli]|uniref:GNAT family N-acetyltransferase n=1 Tax=Paenibacillus silvisoli TaxID=3110539 RepID=UPI0028062BCA|nr:GNAT family N-acetyltransferase [Paenibacillus silvisoli]
MTEIRWARLEDAQTIGTVHAEAYRDTYRGLMPDDYLELVTPAAREHYFRSAILQGTEQIAIILQDQTAAGCMTLQAAQDVGEISAIYLLRRFRGAGLGKQALDWGIEQLRSQGCSKAVLWVLGDNQPAIRFYEKQGFASDGTERVIHRGADLIQVRYQRLLV